MPRTGRPAIGPKVQTQLYQLEYDYIRAQMSALDKTEAEVVRELIEDGVRYRLSRGKKAE